MELTALSLTNYRSYRALELRLGPGLTVLHGDNGQGKSNLLEAVYVLAIGKSYRAPTERDLVSWEAADAGSYAIAAASLARTDGRYELRVGLDCANAAGGGHESLNGAPGNGRAGQKATVQKRVRINGVPKRTSQLVGVLTAVLFSAEDIDLVFGPPSGRRRYVDVVLAQTSTRYVRALQRYQRVLTQRNSVLRRMKEGHAREDELLFWDGELCKEGGAILAARHGALERLAPLAAAAFARLSGGAAAFGMAYAGSVGDLRGPLSNEDVGEGEPPVHTSSAPTSRESTTSARTDDDGERDARDTDVGDGRSPVHPSTGSGRTGLPSSAGESLPGDSLDFQAAYVDAMREALERTRAQERGAGMTLVGPHRDDLRFTLGGVEMSRHASRGQARLAALALRLAEGELLRERGGDAPVLLLDDILSELDESRRALVLEEASRYPQVLVTTADLGLVPSERLAQARRLRIEAGEVLEEVSGEQ